MEREEEDKGQEDWAMEEESGEEVERKKSLPCFFPAPTWRRK